MPKCQGCLNCKDGYIFRCCGHLEFNDRDNKDECCGHPERVACSLTHTQPVVTKFRVTAATCGKCFGKGCHWVDGVRPNDPGFTIDCDPCQSTGKVLEEYD